MIFRSSLISVVSLLIFMVSCTSALAESGFEFALIGDTPYDTKPGEKDKSFDRLVKHINQQSRIKWVMHAGDIKSGGSPCSDDMFKDRLNRFNQFKKPFILTLGDNEWTDCHRVEAGEYQPLERLKKLREIFYSTPGITLGMNPMRVETQGRTPQFSDYVENVRWTEDNVMFTAMHIVGSNNGLDDFDSHSSAKRSAADNEEVTRRTDAALAWMEETFSLARSKKVAGVFLMIHANPGLDFIVFNRDGYIRFVTSLDKLVREFGKPVVLAHGDTHSFQIDSPVIVNDSAPDNFTRVETFGKSNNQWIRVQVNPEQAKVFSFVKERVK